MKGQYLFKQSSNGVTMVSPECIQRKKREEEPNETQSTALPHLYCLIYTASNHIGCRLVEIQGGNKVFMRIEGLHASLVLVIPYTKSLVISTTQNKLPPRMEQNSTYPIIMTHKSHKAHASTDVPHLNSFVSGTR